MLMPPRGVKPSGTDRRELCPELLESGVLGLKEDVHVTGGGVM